jgi:flavin reductase (DIM6/NTAB) family NADH-FMN oxidoreductase RutF/DNA-binding GntR family transcriptional regulator
LFVLTDARFSTVISDNIALAASRVLTPAEFRDVIGHFASGVTVITATSQGRPIGTTASAVSSLSLDPPMVLICMNRESKTGRAISLEGTFAINILAAEQASLAKHFATKDPHKFASVFHEMSARGLPVLTDVLAHLECQVTEQVTGGTHTVFLAEVLHASARGGSPLAYFRGSFGRLMLANDEHVALELRELIVTGELAAGQDLDVRALAERLNVPMTSLLFGIGVLVTDGLLVSDGGRYRVAEVSLDAVHDAMDARALIESGIAASLAERRDDAAVARLRALLDAADSSRSSGSDFEAVSAAAFEFHDALVDLGGSRSLSAAYRRLGLRGLMMSALTGHVITPADDAFSGDHSDLVSAIEAGDSPAAIAVVYAHTARIKAAQGHAFRAGHPRSGKG